MADNERLVEFELLGQKFKLYTAASEKEMQSILALVREVAETDNRQPTGTLPVGKIAILACMNLASRHLKLQQEFDGYRRDSEQRLERVNNEIRSHLITE